MGRYQRKEIPMSQVRDQKDKVADVQIYQDNRKAKAVSGLKIETVEDFLQRGGKITVLKSKAHK